jgi:Fe-S-cluster containining protein
MERLAKGLGISIAQLKENFLVEYDTPEKYRFSTMPCPFLKDNLCSQYEYRPDDCMSYPHVHKKDFTSRLMGIVWNCSVCPIVYNVYEELKREIWY